MLALLGVYWSKSLEQYLFTRYDPSMTAVRLVLFRDLPSELIGNRTHSRERAEPGAPQQGLVIVGVALDDDLAWADGHPVLWDSSVSSLRELASFYLVEPVKA